MNKEDICSQSSREPEISMVLSVLDSNLSNLQDEIGLLVQKLKPVLESERPKDCYEERNKGETELGENLLQKSDRITGMTDTIRDLVNRISL